MTLPGVGRKTANVVRSVAFGLPGLPVDTHVQRLSHRLGLTEETDPVKVELALNPWSPPPIGCVQPPADPPRTGHLYGAVAPVRPLPAGRLLSGGPVDAAAACRAGPVDRFRRATVPAGGPARSTAVHCAVR